VGNITELVLSWPTSGGQWLLVELSVFNFHGELGQWHQGLAFSPIKKQSPNRITSRNSDEQDVLPLELCLRKGLKNTSSIQQKIREQSQTT
jgi:hypothetical protein